MVAHVLVLSGIGNASADGHIGCKHATVYKQSAHFTGHRDVSGSLTENTHVSIWQVGSGEYLVSGGGVQGYVPANCVVQHKSKEVVDSDSGCDSVHPKANATRVGVFVLGESVCASVKKAHIPMAKLHGLDQAPRILWAVTSSEADDMLVKLLNGAPEAQNLVFSTGPPAGVLDQVWIYRRSPFTVERAKMVARFGVPAQELSKWDTTFQERYRNSIWMLPNNTVINLTEGHVRRGVPPYGEIRLTRVEYISRDEAKNDNIPEPQQ
jgi:hypothetical protein